MIWYLNSKLDLNLSCAKGFQNLNSMVTLVYKLKKIIDSNKLSAQFIKIMSHYKKIGYNINVLQQTACLVSNPITVGNFAFRFNCKRESDFKLFGGSDLSFDEMVGASCFGYWQAHRG